MSRNQRLNATLTIGSILQRSVGKHLNIVSRGLSRVNSEISDLSARRADLQKKRRELERMGQSVEALDREYEQLGRTLDDLRRRQERYERALAASRRVGQDFGRMTSEVGRLARGTAIAVGAAGAAIVGLTNSTAALGDQVAKTADNLGIGIEPFQELRYAAERSGMTVEQFDSSLTAFTRRIGQAAEGTGSAVRALDQLGLSAQELVNMAPEEALGLIADRLQDIESPAERAALAADLFSRQGIGMVNMLRNGSEGLEQLRADARATGYVLSEEAARDAEAYQDAMLDAKLAVAGLRNTVGAELMPVVQEAAEGFTGFMVSNREQVVAFAERLAGALRDALPVMTELASGLARVGSAVGSVTGKVAEMVGGWENLGMIIGGLFASKAVAAVGSFAFSVGRLAAAFAALAAPAVLPVVAAGLRAIGAALIANPIGAAVMAISTAALLIMTNWEKVGPLVRAGIDMIGEGFTWLWESAARPVIAGLMSVGTSIVQAWATVREGVSAALERIAASFAQAGELIRPVVDALKSAGAGIVEAWSTVQAGLSSVLDSLASAFQRAWSLIQPVIDGLRWVGERGGAIAETVRGIGAGRRESLEENAGQRGQRARGGEASPVARAIGGQFSAGPVLVGERGPELRYERASGFIAHHRALERMAQFAQNAAGGLAATTREAAQQVANVTQNITVNAQGMSAREIVAELERHRQSVERGALFDGATGYGQYGGHAYA